MPMTVGELSVNITANSRSFQSNLTSLRSQGNSFVNGFTGSLNNLSSVFTSVGGAAMQLGSGLTKYVSLPLAAAGVAVFKMGKDFESELSKITGLVGISSKQVDKWGKQIINLAPDIGRPPKELAEALYFVTSAGIKGADAMDVLTLSGKAASSGLGETKVIADLVTSAMNAYGKENLSAKKATDILVSAVREGKTDAAELTASLGQVLPIASKMGVTFDQVAAAEAAMTRTGTPATEAATQLKSILSGLIKPSKQAEEQLQKMGTSSAELRKSIKEKGLIKTLAELSEMTNKYGEEAMARVFPNIRALSGVFDLLGSNSEDNIEIFDKLEDSSGSLDKAFKAASETLDFKWNKALSKLQATGISAFGALKSVMLPVLEAVIKVLDFVGKKFQGLSPTMQKFAILLAVAAAAVGPLITVIGTIITTIGLAILAFSEIAAALAAIGAPILIAIGAIAAIIPVFAGLLLSSESLRNGIKNKFQDIAGKIKEVASWIKSHADDIKAAFSGLLKGLQTGNFDSLRGALVDLIPASMIQNVMSIVTAFENFRNKAIDVRDNLLSFGSTLVSNLEPLKQMLLDMFARFDGTAIIEAFNGMKASLEPLMPILGGIAAIIVGVLIGAINGIVSAFDNVIAIVMSLVGIIADILGVIVGLVTLNTDLIQKSFDNMWTNLINLASNFVVGILDLISGFVDGVVGFFQYLYDVLVGHSIIPDMIKSIINCFKNLATKIKGIVTTFVNSVVNFFKNLKSKAIQIFNNLKSNVSNIWNNIKSTAINVWNNIKSRITSLISNLISSARSKFNSMKSTISSIFNAIKSTAVNAWNRLKSSVVSVISNLISSAKTKFSSFKTTISSILNNIGNISLKSAGQKIIRSLVNGIKSMYGKVSNVCRSVATKIRDFFPFSPAKEGPLRDLDKIDFYSSIKKSLDKAKAKLTTPVTLVAEHIASGLTKDISIPDIVGTASNKSVAFNGPMYFNGVNDIYDFMKKMTELTKRYTGRRM